MFFFQGILAHKKDTGTSSFPSAGGGLVETRQERFQQTPCRKGLDLFCLVSVDHTLLKGLIPDEIREISWILGESCGLAERRVPWQASHRSTKTWVGLFRIGPRNDCHPQTAPGLSFGRWAENHVWLRYKFYMSPSDRGCWPVKTLASFVVQELALELQALKDRFLALCIGFEMV